MKKILLWCIVISLISVTSWAQPPIDIKGWNNTSWGMTEENIRQSFKGQITDVKKQEIDEGKFYRNLKLKEYNIDGVNFDVLFEMGSTDNKLRRVRLVCSPSLPSYFSQFEQLLTEKYGQPKSKDESQSHGSFDKTASWSLPSTQIQLIFSQIRGLGSILNIVYSDQSLKKESSGKL